MNELMQVIVQSGGKGTRLSHLTKNKPKCFLTLDNKSIFHYQYENLKKYNLHKKITIIVNKDHYIHFKNFFKNKRYQANIIKETPGLGSGGSLIRNQNVLENKFILIYSDIFFNINFNNFLKKFKNENKIFSHITTHKYDSDRILTNDDNTIFKILKKNSPTKDLSKVSISGIFFFNKKIFKLKKIIKIDLRDLVIKNMQKTKFYSYFSNEKFLDFGTIDRFNNLKKNFKKKIKKTAFIFDRDGTIISEKNYTDSKKKIFVYKKFYEFLNHIDKKNVILICITNQPGIAKGFLKVEELKKIHEYLNFLINKKTSQFFDRFYYCPHYPISGYKNEIKKYKINCKCRKPKTGMFKQAITDFDLKNCNVYNIGNSINDIIASKKVGIKNNYLISLDNKIILNKKLKYTNTNYDNLMKLI